MWTFNEGIKRRYVVSILSSEVVSIRVSKFECDFIKFLLYYDCAVQQMWNCVITLVVIVPQKIKSHQTVWCHEIVHENCTAYLMSFSSTLKNVVEWYILLKMNWNVWWFLISLLTLWGAIKCQVFPRTLIIVSHCTGKSFSEALTYSCIN